MYQTYTTAQHSTFSTAMVRILLADHHQLVREGFGALLKTLDLTEVVGEASDGEQVLNLLRSGCPAEVVLMAVQMPILDGIATTEQVTLEFPRIRVIILTAVHRPEVIKKAVAVGAKGFLFKDTTKAELQEAIKRVSGGETYFGSEVVKALLQTSTDPEEDMSVLSEREKQILTLVAEGFSSVEIGEKLFISPRTVDTHRHNLIQKLHVNGLAGLVRFAVEHKLV